MKRILLLIMFAQLTSCLPDLGEQDANIFANAQDLTGGLVASCIETDEEFFNRSIWPLLSSSCAGCHSENNDFTFSTNRTTAYTDVLAFIAESGDMFANKPSQNGVSHGGGIVIGPTSFQAEALAEMVVRSDNPVENCIGGTGGVASETGFEDVTNINAARTVRKAALLLKGRMPTNAEMLAAQGGDETLRIALRDMMSGATFDNWLMTSANDQLLTRKYFDGDDDAVAAITESYNPYTNLTDRIDAASDAREAAEDLCDAENGAVDDESTIAVCRDAYQKREVYWATRDETDRAIADEPLQLIRHVVANELPYSEILTANYMMMNPFLYDVLDGATWSGSYNSMDSSYWRPAHIRNYEYSNGNGFDRAYLPSAGILTSPAFLARYPSTDTNRNRARARWVYYYFLGFDIERSVVRAMDPEELKNVTNPADKTSSCSGCHIVMDPVAGAFQSWGNAGQFLVREGIDSLPRNYVRNDEEYVAGDQWYRSHYMPGFKSETPEDIGPIVANLMPVVDDYGVFDTTALGSFDDGLQWLGSEITGHEDFSSGTAKFWFKGVFGREPSRAPQAEGFLTTELFNAAFAVYDAEQKLIDAWAAGFTSSQLNLKDLLVDMLMSPLFRGESLTGANEIRSNALDVIGLGRLLSPEQLDRKISSTTQFDWKVSWQDEGQLLRDYYMFYGGMDSDEITTRITELNSLMYSVVERMANEISCEIVIQEFWPGMEHHLFAGVSYDTDPSTAEGEMAIRGAIDNMMWRLWGVSDDTEQEALWQLYKALYDQRIAWTLDDDENGGVYVDDYMNDDHTDTEAYDEYCRVADYDANDGVDVSTNWSGIDWNDRDDIYQHLGSYYNPEQTLRPWVGVLSVMLSDTQFVTE